MEIDKPFGEQQLKLMHEPKRIENLFTQVAN
jgi:hypothetical protein